MEEESNQGMSTGKRVAAAAAVGLAVPAAVGVAKKLLGDDESSDGSPQSDQRSSGSSGSSSGSGARAGSTSRKSSSSTKSSAGTAKKSAAKTSRRSSTSARRSTSSRTGSSSSGRSTQERTKEQLYAQAKRLGIEGRSSMTKAQLERAISRGKS